MLQSAVTSMNKAPLEPNDLSKAVLESKRVCVCVCERDRERERERTLKKNPFLTKVNLYTHSESEEV